MRVPIEIRRTRARFLQKIETFRVISRRIFCSTSVKARNEFSMTGYHGRPKHMKTTMKNMKEKMNTKMNIIYLSFAVLGFAWWRFLSPRKHCYRPQHRTEAIPTATLPKGLMRFLTSQRANSTPQLVREPSIVTRRAAGTPPQVLTLSTTTKPLAATPAPTTPPMALTRYLAIPPATSIRPQV